MGGIDFDWGGGGVGGWRSKISPCSPHYGKPSPPIASIKNIIFGLWVLIPITSVTYDITQQLPQSKITYNT